MKKTFALIMIAALALSGCNKGDSDKIAAKPQTGKYIAKVNNVELGESDMLFEFNQLPDEAKVKFMGEEGAKEFVKMVVNKEVLYQEALKQKINETESYKKQVNEYKKRLMISTMLETEIKKRLVAPTDKEVMDFYEANKQVFMTKMPGAKKPVQVPFEIVKEDIRRKLAEPKEEEAFNTYVDTLKKTYNIQLNEEALKAVLSNTPKAEPGTPENSGKKK